MDPALLPLVPPALDRAHRPVHLDADGRAVPDPRGVLGVAEDADPTTVREAFKRALLAHPPEREPRRAEQIRQARDRLLDPAHLLTRELGVAHVPDGHAWGLVMPDPPPPAGLTPEMRLLGQLAVLCLVEEELWNQGLGACYADAIAAATR